MTGEEDGLSAPAVKRMRLRYQGRCRNCGTVLEAGLEAYYDRDSRTVFCIECPRVEDASDGPAPVLPYSEGQAGGAALREFERRHTARDAKIEAAHPKTAGLRRALTDDPESTRAWATGAVGEMRLGEHLTGRAGPLLRVLHDRQVPKSTANIDHIAICPQGVFVIDAKRYRDKRPERRGGTLYVGGRDGTKLVEGVVKQVEIVRAVVAATMPETPVRGVLCFIEADFPVLGGDFAVQGVDVLWPRRLYATLEAPGPLDESMIAVLHERLRTALPAYSRADADQSVPAKLAEPPRRKVLPLLIKPILALVMLALLYLALTTGVAAELGRFLGTWITGVLRQSP